MYAQLARTHCRNRRHSFRNHVVDRSGMIDHGYVGDMALYV